MDARQFIKGSYLKATDFSPEPTVAKIQSVESVELPDSDGRKVIKPVLHLEGFNGRGIVLNKTNLEVLMRNLGTHETDQWIGREVSIRTERVSINGRTVDAIRIVPEF